MTGRRLREDLGVALAACKARLLVVSRYPGQLALEVALPIAVAAMPIVLGRSVAGDGAAENFASNTGTQAYVPYLLLGASVFILVTRAFWDMAYWLRFEQETCTLESLFVTPADPLVVATGVALYSAIRSLGCGVVAFFAGCAVFRVDPLQGDVVLALAFMVVGLVPTYAMALLLAGVVLRTKASGKLLPLAQWIVALLMGVYFPVSLIPGPLRLLALAFPPTWMANAVRSATYGTPYFLGRWYLDMIVLGGFLVVAPLVAARVFRITAVRLRATSGVGGF